jgi:hypothetical protein
MLNNPRKLLVICKGKMVRYSLDVKVLLNWDETPSKKLLARYKYNGSLKFT